METINLLGYDRQALTRYFNDRGERSFRADQLTSWVHRLGVLDFHAMTDMQQDLRGRLSDDACLQLPRLLNQQVAADGVHKWLFGLADGLTVETVFIPEKNRGTLCVSSQVGCPLNCRFCATGALGFRRQLDTAEIIGQLWLARHILSDKNTGDSRSSITNVVMMGMGEPLLNLKQVLPAWRLMLDERAYGLSWRRVTISTVGIVPGIRQLSQHAPVALAISLHAADDEKRSRLVPINKKYPLQELIAACHDFCACQRGEPITFEYTLLDDVNDHETDARQVAELLRGLSCKINLIPFNPYPGASYAQSSPDRVQRFQSLLMEYGYITTVRKTRGQDIQAACGQLAGQQPEPLCP